MRLAPLFVLLLAISPMFGQQPPADAPPSHAPGGNHPAPKNLKILKPEEVMGAMHTFRVSLGVQCTFCHVQGNFAADEKPEKEMARTMLTMVRDINSKYLDGKAQVSCYTCHRGATEPVTALPPDPPKGE